MDAPRAATRPPPPASEAELVARATELSGLTFADVAARFGHAVPPDLRRAKGFVGSLLELALGATASSRAAPDFEALGVELKSLPIGQNGTPCESTFVCTIDLTRVGDVEWDVSLVKRKLSRVLFVPVEGDRALAVATRRVGTPFLWTPSAEDEAALRFDWEELAGLIGRGEAESITGHLGRHLQVRPKAANGASRRRGVDTDGTPYAALPRGFYLRATFTAKVLREHFPR